MDAKTTQVYEVEYCCTKNLSQSAGLLLKLIGDKHDSGKWFTLQWPFQLPTGTRFLNPKLSKRTETAQEQLCGGTIAMNGSLVKTFLTKCGVKKKAHQKTLVADCDKFYQQRNKDKKDKVEPLDKSWSALSTWSDYMCHASKIYADDARTDIGAPDIGAPDPKKKRLFKTKGVRSFLGQLKFVDNYHAEGSFYENLAARMERVVGDTTNTMNAFVYDSDKLQADIENLKLLFDPQQLNYGVFNPHNVVNSWLKRPFSPYLGKLSHAMRIQLAQDLVEREKPEHQEKEREKYKGAELRFLGDAILYQVEKKKGCTYMNLAVLQNKIWGELGSPGTLEAFKGICTDKVLTTPDCYTKLKYSQRNFIKDPTMLMTEVDNRIFVQHEIVALAERGLACIWEQAKLLPLAKPPGLVCPRTCKLNAEQRAAITNIQERRFTAITGGPGTGKSFICKLIASLWPGQVVFASQYNQNLQNLKISMSKDFKCYQHSVFGRRRNFGTIASLIYRDDPIFTHNVLDKHPRLLIVDEAGVCGVEDLYKICNKALSGDNHEWVSILLVGDTSQLPPIAAGWPFKDFLDVYKSHNTELTECKRTDEMGIINQLKKIKKASADQVIAHFPVLDEVVVDQIWQEKKGVKAMLRATACGSFAWTQKKSDFEDILKASYSFQDVSQTTQKDLKYTTGDIAIAYEKKDVRWINEMLHIGHKKMNGYSRTEKHSWVRGTRLVCNFPEREESHKLYKGQKAIVWESLPKDGGVRVMCEGGSECITTSKGPWVLGFCMTGHMAQGCEFNHVYVYATSLSFLNNNWLYTAISRAQKRVLLYMIEYHYNNAIVKFAANESLIPLHIRIAKERSRRKPKRKLLMPQSDEFIKRTYTGKSSSRQSTEIAQHASLLAKYF